MEPIKNYSTISIVTPTYNQAQYIEQTILSVLEQGYPNLEYIVIDGGSTDGTIDIVKKYEKYLKYWVTEKDKGQVDAINKGLRHCSGEIFNWLNSDDYLEQGALITIAKAFENDKVQVVAGKVRNFSATEEEFVPNQLLSAEGLMCWEQDVKFVQPGVWMRRDLFMHCGGINETFHYAFDWDLMIRYLHYFPNVAYVPDLLVHFRLHEASKTVSNRELFANEEKSIIEHLYKNRDFIGLHEVCKWKIDRTNWTVFLNKQINDNESKLLRLQNILTKFSNQPKGTLRMTLGACKQVLLGI